MMRSARGKPKPDTLGAVGNIMILERELGKLEYRLIKLRVLLESKTLDAAQEKTFRAERVELESRRPELVKLLDQENARLGTMP